MEARCMLCGKKDEIDKNHPKWSDFQGKTKITGYICLRCTAKINFEANESQKVPKPM
ncbi:DUF2197 domain-containing protein [Heliobacterium undosum]|uniref:DUF2197 domain-containing protein n=1 Tax=Heliomicrobium undosum TaxID=121734 RepID=A0A845L0W1_9FIRM|nr:DUF2197 domain-containing protein [Heliomicrobium undosum]MZP28575.1 DUF2197 domain-containing protein [Heliomicrobium undosum]